MTQHYRTRMALARKAILTAGGHGDAKNRGRAFSKVAATLPENPQTGAPYTAQAVRKWYEAGKIPRGQVEALARLAGQQPWDVDPDAFPPPLPEPADPADAGARA